MHPELSRLQPPWLTLSVSVSHRQLAASAMSLLRVTGGGHSACFPSTENAASEAIRKPVPQRLLLLHPVEFLRDRWAPWLLRKLSFPRSPALGNHRRLSPWLSVLPSRLSWVHSINALRGCSCSGQWAQAVVWAGRCLLLTSGLQAVSSPGGLAWPWTGCCAQFTLEKGLLSTLSMMSSGV